MMYRYIKSACSESPPSLRPQGAITLDWQSLSSDNNIPLNSRKRKQSFGQLFSNIIQIPSKPDSAKSNAVCVVARPLVTSYNFAQSPYNSKIPSKLRETAFNSSPDVSGQSSRDSSPIDHLRTATDFSLTTDEFESVSKRVKITPDVMQKGDSFNFPNSATVANQVIKNSSVDYIFGETTLIITITNLIALI